MTINHDKGTISIDKEEFALFDLEIYKRRENFPSFFRLIEIEETI